MLGHRVDEGVGRNDPLAAQQERVVRDGVQEVCIALLPRQVHGGKVKCAPGPGLVPRTPAFGFQIWVLSYGC